MNNPTTGRPIDGIVTGVYVRLHLLLLLFLDLVLGAMMITQTWWSCPPDWGWLEVAVIVVGAAVVIGAPFLRRLEGTSPQRCVYRPENGVVVVAVVVVVVVAAVWCFIINITSEPGNGGQVDSVSQAHHSEKSFSAVLVVVIVVVAGGGAVGFAEAARLEHPFYGGLFRAVPHVPVYTAPAVVDSK